MKEREQWVSKLGFILATAGSAIGLGNIWKFPGKVGAYGGGAFILCYILIVILVGFPSCWRSCPLAGVPRKMP